MLSYSIKMLLPPPQKNVHVPTKHNCIPAKRSRIHKNTLAFATKQKKSSQKPLHSHKKQPHSKKIPTFIQNESHSKRTRIYTKRSDSHKNCLRSHSTHLHSYEALSHSHKMNFCITTKYSHSQKAPSRLHKMLRFPQKHTRIHTKRTCNPTKHSRIYTMYLQLQTFNSPKPYKTLSHFHRTHSHTLLHSAQFYLSHGKLYKVRSRSN